MKNKKTIFGSITAIVLLGAFITGCKKSNGPTQVSPIDDATQQSVTAGDQSKIENETNQCMDDANTALQGISTTRGVESFPFCNITIDSSQKATGLIVLNYNGNNCDNTKSRSGSISIQLPYNGSTVTRWRVQGAKITLTFNNYKVTNLIENKSLTLNGTHSITNVSGGVVADLLTNPNSIVHKVRANMVLTFDDGTNRTWGAARTRTFSISNSIISASIAGDTAVSGYSNTAMWGTNRIGETFEISIPTPVVFNIYGGTCLYRPLSGVRILNGLAHVLTVTYGVDANGNAATGCPYGYKANWINGQGVAKQIIKPY